MIALREPAPDIPAAIDRLTRTVSASRLACFHSCRLKFFFRYVEEIRKPCSAALFVGRMVHEALRVWSKTRWKGGDTSADALRPGFEAAWVSQQKDEPVAWNQEEETEASLRQKTWGLVAAYLAATPIPANEKPQAVEVSVEADLSAHGLPRLTGIIDLVRPPGIVVDYKTAAQTTQPERLLHQHESQLAIYGLLYREATGERESGFEIHSIIKTKVPKILVTRCAPMDQRRHDNLLRSIESYMYGVEANDFVPSPGIGCAACEYLRECRQWNG